ncbi:hypothetical protein llap_7223 [Limosa lapponica baueri]|uniref:RecA family profile 1 domain-containing protein n=1 Tax=Limosa lapponica baueri TaxID=1758121 RepID=A0A2I0U8T4_LIMLA|nr:hypothetical protein llap_7223 [Limosa lapponica baueri]
MGLTGLTTLSLACLGIMAAKKLRRARLSQELCERLSRHQITTCQDFLCLSLLELMKVTGKSYYDVQKLLCKVSRACAPKMQTAYEMKLRKSVNPSSAFLSTTLHSLDEVLHGGVPCGSLTELTSPPGCGKTQFCIMMSVLATLPVSMGGLDGAVIYIDTESAFSAERLIEIAGNRFPTYFDSDEKLFCMTRSIHLYRELTCGSVLKRPGRMVKSQLPENSLENDWERERSALLIKISLGSLQLIYITLKVRYPELRQHFQMHLYRSSGMEKDFFSCLAGCSLVYAS